MEAVEAGADIETRQHRSVQLQSRSQSSRAGYFHEEDSVLHQTLSNEPQETIEFVGGVFRLQGGDGIGGKEASRGPGQTPLMLAARAGHGQAVQLLLSMRAMPHVKDEEGMQPLHYAASSGCRECCKALLHARASPTVLDGSGRDPFACLPPLSTADELDRVQWAALLAPRERQFLEDPSVGHFGSDDIDRVKQRQRPLATFGQPRFLSLETPRVSTLEVVPEGQQPPFILGNRGCSTPCQTNAGQARELADAADAAAGAGGVLSIRSAGQPYRGTSPLSEAGTGMAPDPVAVPMPGLWKSDMLPIAAEREAEAIQAQGFNVAWSSRAQHSEAEEIQAQGFSEFTFKAAEEATDVVADPDAVAAHFLSMLDDSVDGQEAKNFTF